MVLAMVITLAMATALVTALAFTTVVLRSGNGNDERTHSQKKKMTHLSTCSFEVPRPSLVAYVHVLAVGRERGVSSLLQSWGVGDGNDEHTEQSKKITDAPFNLPI